MDFLWLVMWLRAIGLVMFVGFIFCNNNHQLNIVRKTVQAFVEILFIIVIFFLCWKCLSFVDHQLMKSLCFFFSELFSFSLLLVWEDFEIYHELSFKWLMILVLGISERIFILGLKRVQWINYWCFGMKKHDQISFWIFDCLIFSKRLTLSTNFDNFFKEINSSNRFR